MQLFKDCCSCYFDFTKESKCNSVHPECMIQNINLDKLLSICDTGDIILFSSETIVGNIIKKFTNSKYTHVGIIIKNKDSVFIYDSNFKNPNESGVTISPLKQTLISFKGEIFYRKLKLVDNFNKDAMNTKLSLIHNTLKNKFYDWIPNNWVAAYLSTNGKDEISRIISDGRHLDRMFCSSFVAYIYTQLGFLEPNTEWSFIAPCEFGKMAILYDGSILEKEISINIF